MRGIQNDESSAIQSTNDSVAIEFAIQVEELARNQPENALQISANALNFFRTTPNPEAEGRVLNASAYALSFLGRYEQSMESAKEAETLATFHNLGNVLARSQMLQGNILQLIGEYTRAINQYLKAASHYNSVGNQLYLGYCYHNMANTYRAAGHYQSALDYYEKYKKINNDGGVNKGIGDTLLLLGQTKEALSFFNTALNLYQLGEDHIGIALIKNSMGDGYMTLGQYQNAFDAFNESYEISLKFNQTYSKEYSVRGKARALLKLGNLIEATEWSNLAWQIASEREEKESIISNYELRAEILKAQNKIEESLDLLIQLRVLEKRYKTEQDSTQLLVMQALFESEAKAKEIKELEEKNKVLELEREVKQKQNQYTLLMAAGLAGALTFMAFWAWTIYREKRRLALLSEELDKARLVAEQATQTKSAFLANMSHEIRTPLTSIIGYADSILQGDIEPKEQKRVVGIICENGNHLLHVINDILDFTKIEANKLEYEELDTPLFPLFTQIESVTGKRAQDKGLNFELQFQYPLPSSIVTDPTRLRQILFNLTNNALKFTNKGSISVSVKSVGEQLSISIKDTGIGINKEQQKALFAPFKQADGSINRRFGGSGLGLSISKHLAEGLGGQINLLSEAGKGSEFIVTINMAPSKDSVWVDNPDDACHTVKTQNIEQSKQRNYGNARVLLAEDHPHNRELICLMLRRLKINVIAVENGLQACDAALKENFDLVLMDIQMPVMDGIQALKQLRAMQPNIPVIALTANNMKHEIEEYLREGFNGHVPKPLGKEELITALDKILDSLPLSNGQEGGNSHQTDEKVATTQSEQPAANDTTEAQPIHIPRLPGADDDFVVLTRDYIKQLQTSIIEIEIAWDQHNIDELQELAHKVKGSAGAFGLQPFGDIFDLIELKLKNDKETELDQDITNIVRLSQRYLDVPGADVALGIQNNDTDIEIWTNAVKLLVNNSDDWFDKLSVAITQDEIAVFEILNPLCRQLANLALVELHHHCQQLKSVVRHGNNRQKLIESMAGISGQLKHLNEFFAEEFHPVSNG